jgi:hypothetical protein
MSGPFYRSLGLEISGAKNDRSSLAIVDYFPKTRRLVLADIQPKVRGHDDVSSDATLLKCIGESLEGVKNTTGLCVNGPLSFPHYLEKAAKKLLPLEEARDPESLWMKELWKNLDPQPKPFVPYLQRLCEIHLKHLTPEKFQIPDGMGSNLAPIACRISFLKPYLPCPLSETFARGALHRIIVNLGLKKSLAREYTDFIRGAECREIILDELNDHLPQIFVYNRDRDKMIQSIHCFNAFISALVQHFCFKKMTEMPPRSFPKKAAWIHLPRGHMDWDLVF